MRHARYCTPIRCAQDRVAITPRAQPEPALAVNRATMRMNVRLVQIPVTVTDLRGAAEQRVEFIQEVEERMRDAARKFEFEKAAQLRDRVKALRAVP